MKYLTRPELIALNRYVIQRAGVGTAGVQYEAGLALVIEQPAQVVFGHELYPSIWLKAAFMMQKITKKHVFNDGNKRTAVLATAEFLNLNGWQLQLSPVDGEQMILFVTTQADSESVMLDLAEWLKAHSRAI